MLIIRHERYIKPREPLIKIYNELNSTNINKLIIAREMSILAQGQGLYYDEELAYRPSQLKVIKLSE